MQCTHTVPIDISDVISPVVISASQPPALATACITSAAVTESSSPESLSSAFFTGLAILTSSIPLKTSFSQRGCWLAYLFLVAPIVFLAGKAWASTCWCLWSTDNDLEETRTISSIPGLGLPVSLVPVVFELLHGCAPAQWMNLITVWWRLSINFLTTVIYNIGDLL